MGEIEQGRRPDSLAPIALEGSGIDEEAAAMNKGKGKMILAVVAVLALGGVASVWLMSGVDETRAYGDAGAALKQIEKTGFDRFWGCALEGVDLRNLESRADLVYQVQTRSAQGGIRYARKVNIQCLEALDETRSSIELLSVPAELEPQARTMKEALAGLHGAWQKYIEYITSSSSKFDEAEARPHLNRIAEGWYQFRQGHKEATRLIRERI